jgi:hypothetical protein
MTNPLCQVKIELPTHLRLIARTPRQFQLHVPPPLTQRSLLDALELAYPMLQGTIRDHATRQRRPFRTSRRMSLFPKPSPMATNRS